MATPEERSRMKLVATLGLDAKRPDAWKEYGYKETLGFNDFYNLYDRHGVAYGVVEFIAEKVFQTAPWVIQGPKEDDKKPTTDWETAFAELAETTDLWWYMKEAYAMRLVGAWSALILRFANDENELGREVAAGAILEDMIPVWRGQLQIAQRDALGNATSWNYTPEGYDATEDQTRPPVTLHPSRVYVVGDYKRGRSLLRAGFNAFVDLEKITGGAAEGTLKNSSRQLHVNFEAQAQPTSPYGTSAEPEQEMLDSLNDQTRLLNSRGDSAFVTQGASVAPLVASVPDPEKPFGTSLQVAAASVRLPSRVVVGSQTGERASVEDIRNANERCQGLRTGEVAREVRGLVLHLVRYKALEDPGRITVMWDELSQPTNEDRADLALKMAQTNQANSGTGDPVYSADEIRAAAGLEAGAPEPLGEEDDE